METIFLVGFFRFSANGSEYGFKRMDLHGIFKTREDAINKMSFCDEAGYYEGVLIEERAFGTQHFRHGIRVWLLQDQNGLMQEIDEPKCYKNIVNLIG